MTHCPGEERRSKLPTVDTSKPYFLELLTLSGPNYELFSCGMYPAAVAKILFPPTFKFI